MKTKSFGFTLGCLACEFNSRLWFDLINQTTAEQAETLNKSRFHSTCKDCKQNRIIVIEMLLKKLGVT